MTADKPKSQPGEKYLVRFPEGMREKLAELSKASGRSMNAEIVARLQQSFSADAAGPWKTHGAGEGRLTAAGLSTDEWEQLRALRSRVHRLTAERADLLTAREELATGAPRNERGDLEKDAEHRLWKITAAAHDAQREIHRIEAIMDDLYERVGGSAPGAISVLAKGRIEESSDEPQDASPVKRTSKKAGK